MRNFAQGDMHTGRMPWKNEGRAWDDISTSPKIAKTNKQTH